MKDKETLYKELIPQAESLLEGETDEIACMANLAALLHRAFGFWWTGFYRVVGDELVLGPFQGPVACIHIPYGRGVCGTAWKRNETVVVPDVEEFPGHIAQGQVVAVLDIDSKELAAFDDTDREFLETIVKNIF